jgi:hypothetical protein
MKTKTLVRYGFEKVTEMNPPLHGVTVGWRGHGTTLSDHGDLLLFHYYGGNRMITTTQQLKRVAKFLDDSWADSVNTFNSEISRG